MSDHTDSSASTSTWRAATRAQRANAEALSDAEATSQDDALSQSWRAAQLTPEALKARHEERRASKSRGASPKLAEGADALERTDAPASDEPHSSPQGISPWRSVALTHKGEPSSWREAQLSDAEQKERFEARALKMGERAERRAQKREEAQRSWERSKAKRDQSRQPSRASKKRRAQAAQDPQELQAEALGLELATHSAERARRAEYAQRATRRARLERAHDSAERAEGFDPHERQGAPSASLTSPKPSEAASSAEDQPKKRKGRRQRPPVDGEWLKQAGLRYLGRFSSSEANFRRVMHKKIKEADARASEEASVQERWVEEAVQYAKRFGGLNDEELTRSLLRGMRRQGLSSAMIRQKLKQKGLSAEQVNAAFEEREAQLDPALDQLASAARAARKRRLGPWGPEGLDYPARQKQLASLARRGFSFDIAQRVLKATLEEAEAWLELKPDE